MTDEELAGIKLRVTAWQRSPNEESFLMKMDARALLMEVERLRGIEQMQQQELLALLDQVKPLIEIARAVATEDTLAYENDAGDDQRCVFCYGAENEHGISDYQHVYDYHEWKHAADCPVTKARALLGEGEGETQP